MISLFSKIEIETSSYCNRRCNTCMRNTYPDRQKVISWFKQNLLPDYVVFDLIDQAEELSFRGDIGLQHYNEPLLDNRIINFGKYAKDKKIFNKISFCTNGDFLSEDLIRQIDKVFDEIVVSFNKIENKFKNTKIIFTNSKHIITHFSSDKNLKNRIEKVINNSCNLCQDVLYINHLGEMLLCCEDLIGHFNLGNVKEQTLRELWYSEKHQQILMNLKHKKSRFKYSHCKICPR